MNLFIVINPEFCSKILLSKLGVDCTSSLVGGALFGCVLYIFPPRPSILFTFQFYSQMCHIDKCLSQVRFELWRLELKVNVILTRQTWRPSDIALWTRHLSLDSCVKLLPTEMGSWHCLPASGCPLCVCFNWKLIVRGLLWKWYHCLQTANPAFSKETLVVLFVLVDLRSSKAWRRKGDANILL